MAAPPPSASEPAAPALIDRFRRDLAAALGRPVAADEPLALSVSGGPDSMAMLWLAVHAYPGQVVVATFDHELRPGSAEEAALVAAWCAQAGVRHRTLRPDAPLATANLQAMARQARYRALEAWAVAEGARVLLTAHHADDQAETFLMRANRGSGLTGLAGIRARRRAEGARDLLVVRPLLGWWRGELLAVVDAAGVPFATDPSNVDARFDRARMRRFLAGQDVLAPAQLARAATWLGEAEADLCWAADRLWRERARASATEVVVDVADLPRGLRRRLAFRAVAEVRRTAGITAPAFSDASNVEPLLDALEEERSATQAGVLASAQGSFWRFRRAPPRRMH